MPLVIQGVGNKEALSAYAIAHEARDISRNTANVVLLVANTVNTLNTAIQTQLANYSIDCGTY